MEGAPRLGAARRRKASRGPSFGSLEFSSFWQSRCSPRVNLDPCTEERSWGCSEEGAVRKMPTERNYAGSQSEKDTEGRSQLGKGTGVGARVKKDVGFKLSGFVDWKDLLEQCQALDDAKLHITEMTLSFGALDDKAGYHLKVTPVPGTTVAAHGAPVAAHGTPVAAHGSSEAVHGTPELSSCTTEMSNGSPKLFEGTPVLNSGIPGLNNGAPELFKGTPELHTGTRVPVELPLELCTGTPEAVRDRPRQMTSQQLATSWNQQKLALRQKSVSFREASSAPAAGVVPCSSVSFPVLSPIPWLKASCSLRPASGTSCNDAVTSCNEPVTSSNKAVTSCNEAVPMMYSMPSNYHPAAKPPTEQALQSERGPSDLTFALTGDTSTEQVLSKSVVLGAVSQEICPRDQTPVPGVFGPWVRRGEIECKTSEGPSEGLVSMSSGLVSLSSIDSFSSTVELGSLFPWSPSTPDNGNKQLQRGEEAMEVGMHLSQVKNMATPRQEWQKSAPEMKSGARNVLLVSPTDCSTAGGHRELQRNNSGGVPKACMAVMPHCTSLHEERLEREEFQDKAMDGIGMGFCPSPEHVSQGTERNKVREDDQSLVKLLLLARVPVVRRFGRAREPVVRRKRQYSKSSTVA